MSRRADRDSVSDLSARTYRALLVAYPREFRREYGAQMEQAFLDLCRERRRAGEKIGLARLWTSTILDLASSVVVERSGVGRVGEEEMVLRDYRLAGLGVALLLAPLYFVSASLLKYGLGVGLLFDPLETFLSVAQILAIVLNVYPVLRLGVSREDGAILSTIRIEMKLVNIAVVVLSSMLLVTLLGYVVLENFTHR
jgi:hypothetical protein